MRFDVQENVPGPLVGPDSTRYRYDPPVEERIPYLLQSGVSVGQHSEYAAWEGVYRMSAPEDVSSAVRVRGALSVSFVSHNV